MGSEVSVHLWEQNRSVEGIKSDLLVREGLSVDQVCPLIPASSSINKIPPGFHHLGQRSPLRDAPQTAAPFIIQQGGADGPSKMLGHGLGPARPVPSSSVTAPNEAQTDSKRPAEEQFR